MNEEITIIKDEFDPLDAKSSSNQAMAIRALKKEITNILQCYVGWYDPLCELIQNALDAVDKRAEKAGYEAKIHIIIDLKNNLITVSDNGISFSREQFISFMAPDFSFKDEDGSSRGHKGVGATYLAYGFNYIMVATKNEKFSSQYMMKGGRKWVKSKNLDERPKMVKCEETLDQDFINYDQGTTMTIVCDSDSTPKDLSWIGIDDATSWSKILRVHTGLGQVITTSNVEVKLDCIDKNEKKTTCIMNSPQYLLVDELANKVANIDDIMKERKRRFELQQDTNILPNRFRNLDAVYGRWDTNQLIKNIPTLTDIEIELVKKYNMQTQFSYVYSLSIWDEINKKCGIRKGQHVLYGGIQYAVNNMAQGELITIPLTKNIGRQKQANILLHFENCSVDLGRKGFEKEIQDLGKEISRKMMDGPLKGARVCFKPNSGAAPDLKRENDLNNWKMEMEQHEHNFPLSINDKRFFNPVNNISVLSIPTREQDVIALFNQLLAGGVIRGIKIMSTNERSTYDGLYKIEIAEGNVHLFNKEDNPLGICSNVIEELTGDNECVHIGPKVLEYKYSLDGLIEDLSDGTKNTNDIDLVVAWEAGEKYSESYSIFSYLLEGEEDMRQYHGITHKLTNFDGSYVCDVILLKDLIMFLNDAEESEKLQLSYED